MKQLTNITCLILFVLLFNRCIDDPQDTQVTKSPVTFTFSSKADLPGDRVNSDSLPHSVVITIRNKSNSQIIYDMEKLALFSFGGGYLSESIELMEGNYQIEEFIIVNDLGGVIYLTPKEGSEFESLVSDALPVSFSVSEQDTSQVNLEVISASLGDPVQFGYASFSFNVVNSLEQGLIAHYRFNGNIYDSGPNGINLSLNSADSIPVSYVEDRKGQPGNAIFFDGTYGCIGSGYSYNSNLYNQSEPQSMSFWMKTNDPNSNTRFGGGMIRVQSEGQSRFYTSIRDTQIQLNYGNSLSPPYGDVFLLDTLVSNNEWRHVVFVSHGDGQTGTFYMNGIKVTEDLDFTTSNNDEANPDIVIGGETYESYYIGAIDDVRLYNRALTDREVADLFLQ